MASILDEFGFDESGKPDVLRMVQFGWGMEAVNPYPAGVEARLYKPDLSTEQRTEGEQPRDPLTLLDGLSVADRRGQASQIRGEVKRVLCPKCLWKSQACGHAPSAEYTILEARWCVPHDMESHARKELAITSIIDNLAMITTHEHAWLYALVHLWANYATLTAKAYGYNPAQGQTVEAFMVEKMRDLSKMSERSERRHRGHTITLLQDMQNASLDLIRIRMR